MKCHIDELSTLILNETLFSEKQLAKSKLYRPEISLHFCSAISFIHQKFYTQKRPRKTERTTGRM
ncbi:hypothetical protein RchiOBHm_Chr5g0073251 [Rosa chinensis]|uniref:Uncharacterized protein n=1 Tax=Rosa chinensis TaxID=74649 RepID=A0A2P6QKW4_ROSCH|nr:hypothetical protein RchiOBHm_Chr5g0073251 [Rosa chinensis]